MYTAPVARSTDGVDHTAPPLNPGGTVYCFQTTAPLAASRAVTLPRRGDAGSPLTAETPSRTKRRPSGAGATVGEP